MFEIFIKRPTLSTVISVLITFLGLLSLRSLPITQFPSIEPPSVTVTANYTGASSEVCAKTVATPLERAINGVPGMTYMSSVCSNNGITLITVFFESGTDPDLATVNVQNRVTSVLDELPEEVIKAGVITEKEVNSMLMYLNIISSDSLHDEKFIYNFTDINILHELKRINGVGLVEIMGARDYAMRVWLKPDRMAAYNVSAQDVVNAIQNQNVEAAPGSTGISSDKAPQLLQYVLRYTGKFNEERQYLSIAVKSNSDGSILRLKDIASIEFGSLDYDMISTTDRSPSASIMIKQRPGSNAREVIQNIKERMEELKIDFFPAGMDYNISYDVSRFLDTSIEEVVRTLIEAFILVSFVVFIFLQDWRSTLIPAIAVPVSLVGTFFFMSLFGFSINLLTLFALVLAIGIVVDNAIVVVEAVHVKMHEQNLSPTEAAIASIKEIGGAIIAITLVMSAVFLPVGFMTGPIGVFYRQFSLTLAIAIIISGVNALTLSPALCALLLKKHDPSDSKRGLLAKFFNGFNNRYSKLERKYRSGVSKFSVKRWLIVSCIMILIAVVVAMNNIIPSAFIPTEDQGMIYVNVTLPPGATVERTQAVLKDVSDIGSTHKDIESISTLAGYSLLNESAGSSFGMAMISLKHWHDRTESVNDVIQYLTEHSRDFHDAEIQFFAPPAIPGFGNASGFELRLQDRTNISFLNTAKVTQQFVEALNKRPEIQNTFTNFDPNFPQYLLKIDYDKAAQLGITVKNSMDALQTLVGSFYASNFIRFGQMYKVMVQTSPSFRSKPQDILKLYVKNDRNEMIPVSSFMTLERTYGPEQLTRYNMYTSALINGEPAPGYSSGDAIKATEEVAREVLPRGYSYEWSGVSREEIKSGGQAITIFLICLFFVYLLLAAQYESYLIPFSILLSLPAGIAGSYFFLLIAGLENNVYAQVALIMLIGLLGKNAILIIEFAMQRRKMGHTILQSAIDGASSRLRPILMTSFAFVAGLVPLCLASGAGEIGNRSIGMTAAGGMIAGTLIGIFLVPGLFVIFQTISERISLPRLPASIVVVLLVTLGSCKIRSEAVRTESNMPGSFYSAASADTTNIGKRNWYAFYKDALLTELIDEGIKNNLDRKISAKQIELAASNLSIAQAGFLPFFNVGVRATLDKYGEYTMNGIGNDDTNRSESLPPDKALPNPYPEMFAGITFGWEANLWGKLSARKQSAVSRLLASKEIQYTATSMVVYNVASSYYELLGLDQRKQVLMENIELQELALELVHIQKEGGRVNQLAVDQFESQLLHTRTLLVEVEQQILITEAQINQYLGRYPTPILRDSIESYGNGFSLGTGDPDELIFNRPDIREMEFRVQATNADAKAARAAFYPSLQLTGAAGLSSLKLVKLFDLPGAAAYSIGSGLTAPILQRKQIRALFERAKTNQLIALTEYQRTVLNAYYEVYGVMNNGYNLNRQVQLKQQEAAVQRRAFMSSNDLFGVGYATYLEVITAQRRLLEVELELSDLKRKQLKNAALLYRALGGGWKGVGEG